MSNKKSFMRLMQSLTETYIAIRADDDIGKYARILGYYNDALKLKSKISSGTLSTLKKKVLSERTKSGSQICKSLSAMYSDSYDKDYDLDVALKHVEVLIYANDRLSELVAGGEKEKAAIMASTLHNYPHFLINRYTYMRFSDFYKEHLTYYTREFDEPFLEKFEQLFK
ncbi:MAG: hypothetical protein RR540_06330 [Oscillospiraceae bacterium]